MSRNTAVFDSLRSLGFAGISGTYAPVGSAFQHITRVICFTNLTDADILVSNYNLVDNLIIPAGGFKLFDLNTNRSENNTFWSLPIGTHIYIKTDGTATSGSFYVECLYAQGD